MFVVTIAGEGDNLKFIPWFLTSKAVWPRDHTEASREAYSQENPSEQPIRTVQWKGWAYKQLHL